MKRIAILAVLALVVLGLAWKFCCSKPGKLPENIRDQNVVVILIDTLRADHLPIYGYERDTAPFISSLAKKGGVVFDQAFSASSTTGPAVASVFTSLYPSEHGVITGFIATKHLAKDHPALTLNRIPEDLTTLGEEFKNAGYRTYGIADNLNISSEMGFTQGFDKFETHHYKTAEVINSRLKEWAPEIKSGDGKYFLYLHYMDPHKPYHRRDPWYQDTKVGKQRMVNEYDSEINYVDDKIREMFELFGWDKNTLVVFLADHGEEFFDHGNHGHGKSLYTEVIHVPFIFYHSDLNYRRVHEAVHTMDLIPTLAEILGFPANQEWRGISQANDLVSGHPAADRSLFSELLRREENTNPARRSVVKNNRHLIRTTTKQGANKPAAKTHELYNLENDFTEKTNLAAGDVSTAESLGKELDLLEQGGGKHHASQVEIPMDKEKLKELKSLGYLE